MFINNRKIPLEECEIFKNINEDILSNALNRIHFQIKTYKTDEFISTRNSICNNLMIVIKGTVKTELSDLKGATIHIADINEKDCLAPAFLFGKTNFFPVDIVAKTVVEILFIPKNEVYKLFKLCPEFLTNFLDLISGRTQYLVHKIRFLSFNTLKSKMAFYLLKLADESNSYYIKLNKTQADLAEDFGATRTSVARVLRQLADNNAIKISGKNIEIINKNKISEYLKYEDHIHFQK